MRRALLVSTLLEDGAFATQRLSRSRIGSTGGKARKETRVDSTKRQSVAIAKWSHPRAAGVDSIRRLDCERESRRTSLPAPALRDASIPDGPCPWAPRAWACASVRHRLRILSETQRQWPFPDSPCRGRCRLRRR